MEGIMAIRFRLWASLLSLSFSFAASAQMAVHAVAGTVESIKTDAISLAVDNATESKFQLGGTAGVRLDFSSDLRAAATDATKFHKSGDYVLVYFYGWGNDRTAVAVKDLGPGTYAKLQGTVTAFDKHSRTITLKDDAGKEVSMTLGNDLVVDTDSGVDNGRKFSPHKGDTIRVTYLTGATPTVVFLREML